MRMYNISTIEVLEEEQGRVDQKTVFEELMTKNTDEKYQIQVFRKTINPK